MDVDDLFAVFDSESSKYQQVVKPQEEDDVKHKLDPNAVVSEICGSIKQPSDGRWQQKGQKLCQNHIDDRQI